MSSWFRKRKDPPADHRPAENGKPSTEREPSAETSEELRFSPSPQLVPGLARADGPEYLKPRYNPDKTRVYDDEL